MSRIGACTATMSSWLRHLYAFLRYLVDREVAHPDLLKRKLRVKVPEALPRALDPEDVQELQAVISQSRETTAGTGPCLCSCSAAGCGWKKRPG